jgi:hypothetical protein
MLTLESKDKLKVRGGYWFLYWEEPNIGIELNNFIFN